MNDDIIINFVRTQGIFYGLLGILVSIIILFFSLFWPPLAFLGVAIVPISIGIISWSNTEKIKYNKNSRF